MRLEVITRLPEEDAGRTPLLFVHGACCTAAVWENFLPYFAERGFEAHAVSLRGHGGSEGRERIRTIRVAEYIEDVAQTADRLRMSPVLIGHSLGGYVLQKYLERHTAPAVVLLATAPVSGLCRCLARMAKHHPLQAAKLHLTWTPHAAFETPDLARELLFSPDVSEEVLRRCFAGLQHESYYAGVECTWLNLPRPARVNRVPMLVLGAEDDILFSCREVQATARAYGAPVEFFPNMAHMMMLEARWEQVAGRIAGWLDKQRL